MFKLLPSGTNLHYKVVGQGPSTLVFLHGAFMDLNAWQLQVDELKLRYRVILVDLPGHGYSTSQHRDWTLLGMTADLVEFFQQQDFGKLIFIGHSLGAELALGVAASLPHLVTGFIAIDMFRNAGEPFTSEMRQQFDQFMDFLKSDFANANEQYVHTSLITPGTPEDVSKAVIRIYRDANPKLGMALMKEVKDQYLHEREFLPRLSCKMFLIMSDYKPMDEQAVTALAGKGCEVLYIEASSHFPMLEAPELLTEYIGFALARLESSVPA